ncbi:hypothetical protein [Ktedonospora formicarum]|uniref:hypothetical protein n=1 Tax=Ktedonospora formicarum TaxID=2778364 RepID=UPI001C68D68C|nr:hypothetical protein [Ktedonospora formicarum]
MSLRSKGVAILFLSGLFTLLLMISSPMPASAASTRASVSTKVLGKHQPVQGGPGFIRYYSGYGRFGPAIESPGLGPIGGGGGPAIESPGLGPIGGGGYGTGIRPSTSVRSDILKRAYCTDYPYCP